MVRNDDKLIASVRALASNGVDRIVEGTFGANVEADLELLNLAPQSLLMLRTLRSWKPAGQVSRLPNEFRVQKLLGLMNFLSIR